MGALGNTNKTLTRHYFKRTMHRAMLSEVRSMRLAEKLEALPGGLRIEKTWRGRFHIKLAADLALSEAEA